MVCLSGGKDSYAMLDILLSLRDRAPLPFELSRSTSTRSSRASRPTCCRAIWPSRGVPFHIVEQDTYSVVKRVIPEGGTMCSLCSRLRRGVLYRVAGELGATSIALGHHRDDILATFFLNLFFGGKLKTMPPKLVSDDGKHVVIRPLAYVRERDLARYAEAMAFPIIPCTLCGSQENLQRKQVAAMLRDWQKQLSGPRREHFQRAVERRDHAPARSQPAGFRRDPRQRHAGCPTAISHSTTIPASTRAPAACASPPGD